MNIYITKYKNTGDGVPNYFAVPAVVYADHMIIENHQILESAFSNYTDEISEVDDPFTFTTGGYDLKLSLLRPGISALGKTLVDFFAPATDEYKPVGYVIAIGENAQSIQRGDFIDYESIEVNYRKDDNGYILSFSVIGPEEEYIRRAEALQAQEVTAKINYRQYFSELLNNPLVFKNISFTNLTSARFLLNGFTPLQPVISYPIHNAVLNSYSDKSRWRVFLNWKKDQAFAYQVEHSSSWSPSVLNPFTFKMFYASDGTGVITAPKVVEDEDFLVRNTLKYSLPHLAMYYVSYTSPQLPSQDWLGSLYMNRSETTIGYTNMDAFGLVAGNQQNNIFKDYDLGDWVIRNGKGINEKDMLLPASDRGFIFPSQGVNLGASIGRSLVKDFDYRQIGGIGGGGAWNYFGDSGFPATLFVGPVKEYRQYISGTKQELRYTGKFENAADMKIHKQFALLGKTWLIKSLSDRKILNDNVCIINAVEK
ncbi:MAG TPA: hypothetical protein PK605_00460 [Ignavibacteria bacterium]|nr:hypothetical protein [Bacteroidota bacterium]HRF66011.1 hypothetical protein [Ignavibacteria bacterium]HRJ02851.1 hypothetical protein [Ignavibacteria bacterium]HRJ84409.1 hypothetical protein [Ignavibacteria bacterium]